MKNTGPIIILVIILVSVYAVSLILGFGFVKANPDIFEPSIKPEAFIENRLF